MAEVTGPLLTGRYGGGCLGLVRGMAGAQQAWHGGGCVRSVMVRGDGR